MPSTMSNPKYALDVVWGHVTYKSHLLVCLLRSSKEHVNLCLPWGFCFGATWPEGQQFVHLSSVMAQPQWPHEFSSTACVNMQTRIRITTETMAHLT